MKDGTDSGGVVDLRGSLDAAFEDITGPLRVELRQEGSVPPACHGMEALVVKRNGGRQARIPLQQ